MHIAMPKPLPSTHMIRSMYSTKQRPSNFKAMPYSVCRIAWPARSAAAAPRNAWPPSPNSKL